jgi:hypothetical protein
MAIAVQKHEKVILLNRSNEFLCVDGFREAVGNMLLNYLCITLLVQ